MRIKGKGCETGNGKQSELLEVAMGVPMISFCTARHDGEMGGCSGELKGKKILGKRGIRPESQA